MYLAHANLKGTVPSSRFHLQILHKVQSQHLQKQLSHRPATPRVEGQLSGTPGLTSDAGCVRGGPARSGGLFARKTLNAPVVDLYSNDFSSCIFQNYLPAPVSGFASGKSSGSETCVASGWGTCSPWTSDSSSPWSLCRERLGALVSGVSHSGSESGFGTWTLQ